MLELKYSTNSVAQIVLLASNRTMLELKFQPLGDIARLGRTSNRTMLELKSLIRQACESLPPDF